MHGRACVSSTSMSSVRCEGSVGPRGVRFAGCVGRQLRIFVIVIMAHLNVCLVFSFAVVVVQLFSLFLSLPLSLERHFGIPKSPLCYFRGDFLRVDF